MVLLSKVFYCQDFLNRKRKPESKEILEMLVQYIGDPRDMSHLTLRFLGNPEFKNLTGPTLMTPRVNLGENGSNLKNSANINVVLTEQAL